ncbi:hypothetical protein Hanom_Chr14g01333041 [Helianthus anomalus]
MPTQSLSLCNSCWFDMQKIYFCDVNITLVKPSTVVTPCNNALTMEHYSTCVVLVSK